MDVQVEATVEFYCGKPNASVQIDMGLKVCSFRLDFRAVSCAALTARVYHLIDGSTRLPSRQRAWGSRLCALGSRVAEYAASLGADPRASSTSHPSKGFNVSLQIF